MDNMEERQVELWKDMENTEESQVWIGKIWKKDKLNSDMIWTIWKKGKLNCEKIWKIYFRLWRHFRSGPGDVTSDVNSGHACAVGANGETLYNLWKCDVTYAPGIFPKILSKWYKLNIFLVLMKPDMFVVAHHKILSVPF